MWPTTTLPHMTAPRCMQLTHGMRVGGRTRCSAQEGKSLPSRRLGGANVKPQRLKSLTHPIPQKTLHDGSGDVRPASSSNQSRVFRGQRTGCEGGQSVNNVAVSTRRPLFYHASREGRIHILWAESCAPTYTSNKPFLGADRALKIDVNGI